MYVWGIFGGPVDVAGLVFLVGVGLACLGIGLGLGNESY